jgi:hypothetical protein
MRSRPDRHFLGTRDVPQTDGMPVVPVLMEANIYLLVSQSNVSGAPMDGGAGEALVQHALFFHAPLLFEVLGGDAPPLQLCAPSMQAGSGESDHHRRQCGHIYYLDATRHGRDAYSTVATRASLFVSMHVLALPIIAVKSKSRSRRVDAAQAREACIRIERAFAQNRVHCNFGSLSSRAEKQKRPASCSAAR